MPFAKLCLVFAVLSGAGALAEPPPQAPAASSTPPESSIAAPVQAPRPALPAKAAPPGKSSANGRSDEDLMEFLGADDVGDAAWEFLKHSTPSESVRPVSPQQDAAS